MQGLSPGRWTLAPKKVSLSLSPFPTPPFLSLSLSLRHVQMQGDTAAGETACARTVYCDAQ